MKLTEFFLWCLCGGVVFVAAIWVATWWSLRIPEEEDRRAEVAMEEDGCPYCGAPRNPPDAYGYNSYTCGRHALATWYRPQECVRREMEKGRL